MFKFMRYLITSAAVVACCAHARANVASVEYLHEYVKQRWAISVPHTTADSHIPDMSHVMSVVDKANEILNHAKITNYMNDPAYATTRIASTGAAEYAVDNLIKRLDTPLWVIPATTDTTFGFNVAAGGKFYIDWGDGTAQEWSKGAGAADISHTYPDSASNYTVRIGGEVTSYPASEHAAIFFSDLNRPVRQVGGCMGCVFHTLGDGTEDWQQPKFHYTFKDNTLLTTLPPGFFNGLHGGGYRMFYQTFLNTGLTSLPKNLFGDGIYTPATQMFFETFKNCSQLTGEIPNDLFRNVRGPAAQQAFQSTFQGCGNLTGMVPDGMFAGVQGAAAQQTFDSTFNGCGKLEAIGDNVFGGLSGEPAKGTFSATFANCGNIRTIGVNLLGDMSGAPTPDLFHSMFENAGVEMIPDGLFAKISGNAAGVKDTFRDAFKNCKNLTAIPTDIFGDLTDVDNRDIFWGMFYGDTAVTGPAPKINDQYLWDLWPNLETQMFSNCHLNEQDSMPYGYKKP